MKRSVKELSIVKQSILLLIFFSSLFIFNAWLLFGISKGLGHYDNLHRNLALVENNVVKLEFTLDIFVVAKNFEGDMGEAIKGSVESIDELLETLDEPVHAEHLGAIGMHSGLVGEIRANWEKIKIDVARMGGASSAEEELLIHNEIDSDTFFLIEDVRKLMDAVETQRAEAFEGKVDRAFMALAVSFVVAIIIALVFIMRSLVPVRNFFSHSREVVSAQGSDFIFREDIPGEAGEISRALNKVMERSKEILLEGEEIRRIAENEMGNVKLRLDGLSALAKMFGQSLSYHEISQRAILESLNVSVADAGAIYLLDGGKLRLSVSKGFSKTFFYKGEVVDSVERMSSPGQALFDPLDGYPDKGFVDILRDEGFTMMVSTPIVQGEAIIGFFDVMFKEKKDISKSILSFLETMATNIGAVRAYTELFSREHASKAFLERVFLQMPLGVAIFDKEGLCVLANTKSKEILVGDVRATLVGTYNIFSDEAFKAHGVLPLIERAYDGHIEECHVEYECGMPGRKEVVRLSVQVVPLYKASGDVGHIMVLYEVATPECSDAAKGGL